MQLKHAPLAALAFLASQGLALAVYTPFANDPLTSINPTNWYQNGTLSAGSTGITSATAGSIVWRTVPSTPNDDLATATINIPSGTNGGNYGVLVRATSNANYSSSAATGSFYLLEIQNPTWTSGTCSAGIAFSKSVSGSMTTLFSGTTWCATQFTVTLVVHGGNMNIFVNRNFINSFADSSIATGQPGLNVRGAPAGSTMSLAMFYPADYTAPASINMANLATSSYPYRIDMQWQAPSDGPDGSGLALTIVYRNGVNVAGYSNYIGEFTDNNVNPGTTYSYNIILCDMFYNCSNSVFNATTGPANSIDPRQIGVGANATNWGGGGENINILSGNLNYSLPLLQAKARGGMTVGIGLSYNSQNWRQDTVATWNYGRDNGYGYGFRVGAGSMQQFINAQWGVDHWTFTDSTGTEYRLDQPVDINGNFSYGSGLWASNMDSSRFVYDSNTNRLHFPNGSFWQFDCISLGNEGDETARYPTLMEDSNGNQILIRYKPGVAAIIGTGAGGVVYESFANSSAASIRSRTFGHIRSAAARTRRTSSTTMTRTGRCRI
jgi:hypothetical protein